MEMLYGQLITITLLLAFCVTQQPRRLLLGAGLLGALLGAGGMFAWACVVLQGVSDPSPLVWLVIGPLMALPVGGGIGVMVAVLIAGPPARRAGAWWGIAVGGVVAVALAALVGHGVPDWEHLLFSAHVPFLGLMAGAVYAEGADLAKDLRPAAARSHRRQWLTGTAVVLAILLGPPAIDLVRYALRRATRHAQEQMSDAGRVSPGEADRLLKQLRSREAGSRRAAVSELGSLATMAGIQGRTADQSQIIDALARATRDRDAAVRLDAVTALGMTRSRAAIEPLGKLLEHRDPVTRLKALEALLHIPDYAISPYVRQAAEDKDPRVSGMARRVIMQSRRRPKP